MKLEIITPKHKDRNDVLFYYGKEIAKIGIPNGKKLYLESRGELEIITDNGKVKGVNALDWLKENHNDKSLEELYNTDRISLNNWFAVVEVDINGEVVSDDLVLNGTYDEAIIVLKKVYKDFYSKNYS